MQVVRLDRNRPAADQAHDVLRDWILTGRLKPGETISEPSMAATFAISRTPIREVFKRLQAEGLVEIFPQVGTRVTPIDVDRVRDAQFIRETLELRTVELAARHVAPAEAEALRAALRRQERHVEARDQRGFFAEDEAFHELLTVAAGHPFTWSVIAAAKAQLDRVRHMSLADPKWLRMVFDEHRVILEAVLARDAARARAAMLHHLRTVFSAIDRLSERDPTLLRRTPDPPPVLKAVKSRA